MSNRPRDPPKPICIRCPSTCQGKQNFFKGIGIIYAVLRTNHLHDHQLAESTQSVSSHDLVGVGHRHDEVLLGDCRIIITQQCSRHSLINDLRCVAGDK